MGGFKKERENEFNCCFVKSGFSLPQGGSSFFKEKCLQEVFLKIWLPSIKVSMKFYNFHCKYNSYNRRKETANHKKD